MYKVMLADDERIVREGVARLVQWEALGLTLAGMAEDGLQALEMARQLRPDIVITDIRMPGMDGLELMERLRPELPGARFVILSGYDEFAFASRAMAQGVRHYLLKPCDEDEVEQVLREVAAELRDAEEEARYRQEARDQLERVLPYVKESFFREAALSRLHDEESMESFRQMFGITDRLFNLVVFTADERLDYVGKFSLKKLAEEILGEGVHISTVMQEEVCLLIRGGPAEAALAAVGEVRECFLRYFGQTLSAAVSQPGAFGQLREMYAEVQMCLGHRHYLGGDAVILKSDLPQAGDAVPAFDAQPLLAAVDGGRVEAVAGELKRYFGAMAGSRLPAAGVISQCMELLMELARRGDAEAVAAHFQQAVPLVQAGDVAGARALVQQAAEAAARRRLAQLNERKSALVQKVLACIDENIANPKLTLGWIAGQILYMNSDYLGRLFQRETGERFSQYLLRVRMEKAMALIEQSPENLRIYEISEQVGFPDNPRYFGQVFKKYTGTNPKEYQRKCRQRAD